MSVSARSVRGGAGQEPESGGGQEPRPVVVQRLASSEELPRSRRILAMGLASVLSQHTLVLKLVSNCNLQRELMYLLYSKLSLLKMYLVRLLCKKHCPVHTQED